MSDQIEDARYQRLANEIEHLRAHLGELSADTGQVDDPEPPPSLQYHSTDDFVEGFVRSHFEVPTMQTGEVKWFDCWSRHPMAVWVIEVLWGSFEEARIEDLVNGGAASSANWTVQTFLPLMDRLTSRGGPFAMCSDTLCNGAQQLGTAGSDQQPQARPAAVGALS